MAYHVVNLGKNLICILKEYTSLFVDVYFVVQISILLFCVITSDSIILSTFITIDLSISPLLLVESYEVATFVSKTADYQQYST